MTFLRRFRSQRGAVSWTVVGVISIMVVTMGLAISELANSETFQSVIHRSKNDVYFVADSGRRVAERCFQLYMLGSVKQNIPATNMTTEQFNAIVSSGSPLKFLELGGIPTAEPGVKAKYRVNLNGGTSTGNLVLDTGTPIENVVGPGRTFDAAIEVQKNDAPWSTADYWAFPILFKITVIGTAPTMKGEHSHKSIIGRGTATLYVNKRSWANYVEYTSDYSSMHGEPSMHGRDAFHGPVHTGGMFKFKDSPGTLFQSEVTTSAAEAYFWTGSAWANSSGQFWPIDAKKTYLVKPQFNGGYFTKVVVTDLPGSFAFFRMKTTTFPEPSLTAPSNIYTAADDASLVMRPGGVYVVGDCDINLQNSAGNQVYTFTHYDSSGGVLGNSIVTLDYTTGLTTIQRLGDTAPKVYTGLPDVDSMKAGPQGAIYVRGKVKSVKGSLARNTQLSILSTGSMTITGDITYAALPTDDPTAANILGLMSETSDITISYPGSPADVKIHAHILTPKGEFWCSANAGAMKGKLYLFGSVASQRAGAMGSETTGYAKDYTWDTRATFAPPPLYPQQTKYGVILERPESGNSTWRVVWADETMP